MIGRMHSAPPDPSVPTALVACLCAEWCGVCRDYAAPFQALASQWPEARFAWIDIEDEADLLDSLEVENFPTLLIARGREPLFFGPLAPQPGTLERLLRTCLAGAGAPAAVADPAVHALSARLARREA
ncbi:MAG: thioredoxin family protein [Ramlibacter sp.]|nr:thioredoxin family protein [Ramlibacter sp.]